MRHLIETFIKHKLSIFKRPEIDPLFKAIESDIENVYDQLLDSDEEGNKDEDVEKCRVKKVEF